MSQKMHISVIDPDTARRAQVCYQLSQRGIYAEPLEAVGEISGSLEQFSVFLVYDVPGAIQQTAAMAALLNFFSPIVAYFSEPSPRQIVQGVRAGAVDFVGWPIEPDLLAETLRDAVQSGQKWMSTLVRRHAAIGRLDRLTRRERDVLNAIADGMSNRSIGEKLQISPRTVEIHRSNMLNKIGARHTSEAIRLAVEASIAP
jgi:FixJ family two-component response regulator